MIRLRAALCGVAVLALAAGAGSASSQRGLLVGVTDDAFLSHPAAATGAARELGLGAYRVSLDWSPARSQLAPGDVAALDGLVAASAGLRIVVTVYGKATAAPLDAAARDAYCSYVRDLVTRYRAIDDVVIWNEPNLGFFWQPQFDPDGTSAAPAAYEALLARCWDVLHAARPDVNVIMTTSPSGNDNPAAASNVSHSPGSFIRKLGAAYRASGRTRPIFDTVGHNPYGMDSAESPWRQHLTPWHVAEGDLDRLVQALDDGFGGTAQPLPGACAGTGRCVTVWYLEAGYQTVPDPAHRTAYVGQENDAHAIPDGPAGPGDDGPSESTQLRDGIELAYCQPDVGAFFNFLLWDEPNLARWQSGVFWADGSRKASFDALAGTIAAIENGGVDCARLQRAHGTPIQPSGDALFERIEWPALTAFSTFNEVWTFSVDARVDARFRASVVRAGARTGRKAAGAPLTVTGVLRHDRPHLVQFPQRRLRPGAYTISVSLTRTSGKPLTETRVSPTFVVQ